MERLINPDGARHSSGIGSNQTKARPNITRLFKIFLCVVFSTALFPGCASISRMQSNMDQMTYYMGVVASAMPQMAFSTKRMADTAEGLQQKSEGMMSDFHKKGVSTERAVQNYAQTFIDSDRAIIKNLQGIKEELAQLKQPYTSTKSPDTISKNQERVNTALLERIGKLETQIQALSSKVNKTETSGTNLNH
ncbi:MAG: hypothetical protein ACLQT6_17505 [Desulfomonilaceae bacterium]